jgi:hypothetical protein
MPALGMTAVRRKRFFSSAANLEAYAFRYTSAARASAARASATRASATRASATRASATCSQPAHPAYLPGFADSRACAEGQDWTRRLCC